MGPCEYVQSGTPKGDKVMDKTHFIYVRSPVHP
jgi:hypothetical protein